MIPRLFELSTSIMHGRRVGEILGIILLSDNVERYTSDVLEVIMSNERMFMEIIEVQ